MNLKVRIFEKIRDNKKSLRIYKEKVNSGESITEIAKYFNVNPNIMLKQSLKEKQLVNKKISIANDLITETYSKLTPLERTFTSLITGGNKKRIYNQVQIIESLIKGLKPSKEKDLAVECLKVLKGDIIKKPLSEVVKSTIELKQTILEADDYYGGMIVKKLGSLKFLKNIALNIMHDEKDAPETLYVSFEISFYPLGNDFSSVRASALDIDKRFARLGRSILKTIREVGAEGGIFSGTGIWDGNVRTNGLNPGKPTLGSGEMAIHVNPGKLHSVDEAINALKGILKSLDSLIPTWFPEVSLKAQEKFRKNPNSDDLENIGRLKRQTASAEEPDSYRKDNFGIHFPASEED